MLQRTKKNRICKGWRHACEKAVCQHYSSIYTLLVYLTGDLNLAEDLTQETFTSAWTNIKEYKAKASVKTWLYKIAYNKYIDSQRRCCLGA